MIKQFSSIVLLVLIFSGISFPQENEVLHRVFLTGNLVDISDIDAFNTRVEKTISGYSDPYTIILNGDLISGQAGEDVKDYNFPFKNFLEKFNDGNGKIIIIPGDRDWGDSQDNGWKEVKKLERYVKSLNYKNVSWSIKDGCPGPKTFNLGDHLILLTINTQWWNHPFDKPSPATGECKISTTEDFKEEIEDIINENPTKNLLIAGHFPIVSYGEYGGHLPFYKHIFPLTDLSSGLFLPLPFIGSFYPAFRESIGNEKDIANERFSEIRNHLQNIITQFRSIIYLSGHEKNQQIIEMAGNYFINSGAPETASFSGSGEGTILSEREPGIIEIVYYSNGKVTSKLHKFNLDNDISINEQTLLISACEDIEESTPLNYCYCPCRDMKPPKEKMERKYIEKTKVVAGPEYKAGGFKRFLVGDHYRDDWTAEIEVPYLDLDTTFGGLIPLKRGGGRQTKSLKFIGANGIRYTFRSVNKDPVKALTFELRETLVADIVRDQTTTQHPYGALVADILLNELEIIHAHPKLYRLPDDKKLGPYQLDFGNMLGMLEENPTNPKKGKTGFLGANKILRSHKLFRELYNDHNNSVDTKNFAVARSFDILVGDWGKHDDNWKWIGFQSGKKTIYKPMPRDRDHVFSRWDGVLPWIADREWAKESGEDFNYEISGLRSLMFQGRHLDRFIASNLSKQDWLDAAHFVQQQISDEIIEKAVLNLPKESFEISGEIIEQKLKARIKDLDKYVMEYYQMIASEVDIVGSNKKEYFEAIRKSDGTVDIKVYNVSDENSKGTDLIYNRTFYPDETDDVRLFGLGGKDVFYLSGDSDESIQIKIIGGPGADIITDNSSGASTLVYEKSKKSKIERGTNTEIVSPNNEELYNYNRTAFKYNTYFPLPYIYFNSDDGLIFSLGVDFTFHSFNKKEFSSKHGIRITGTTSESISLTYSGRYHQFLGDLDLLLDGFYDNPVRFTYFYGSGNESENSSNQNFYKTRYNSKGISAGLIYDFWKKSSLSLKIKYENNETAMNTEGTIFEGGNIFGTGKLNVVDAEVNLEIDFRNHSTFSTSGTRFFAQFNNSIITNTSGKDYLQYSMFAEGFLSFRTLLPFTLGIRLGGGDSQGEVPFYKQLSLGQNTFLKGYRNNRFSGESMIFFQSVLRMNLLGINNAPVPLQIGFLGFFNSGRIFQSGEHSDKWHNGYGFGIFIIPLREDFTIQTTFGFSEEESLLIQFGIGGTL